MLTLFKDLSYCSIFIDDLCIASRTMHAHFFHVKTVLQRLTESNLRVNFDKSHFAKSAVYLLGYSISATGKRVDRRKTSNLDLLPPPSTQKQAQSFLGFVNFFCNRVPNASLLMGPLDNMRNHDEKVKGPFAWTDLHQQHFDSIKKVLQSDLILSHPDLSHPFCIATDSSDYGTGCCLYQEYEVILTTKR